MNESLNTTLSQTDIPEDSMLHIMGSMSAAMTGGHNFKMKKLHGSGYLVQFDKDGATELHHVDDNLQGGYIKGNQPSLRLLGTYRSHIKDLLDSGKKVRITAHEKLADSFHRITKGIVDKNPGYKVSPVSNSEHEITGDKLKSWELSK